MRILVAAHNYPRFPGDPAGTYVRQLALGYRGRDHQVAVVVPHARETPEHESENGVEVERFRYAPTALEQVGYRGEARLGRLLLGPTIVVLPSYLLAFRRAIRRSLSRFQPDIIHAHWWLPAGWLSANAGPPLVVTSHGSDVRLLERSGLLVRAARRVAARAARWTAVSRFLAADLERRLSLPDHTVEVTPMPVDVALFEQGRTVAKAAPPRVLYAGNLLPSKGVDVLIAAVALLRDRDIDCQLRILGQGPARDQLVAELRSLRLGDRVTVAPFVPQSDMPREYGAATVTVLPTRGHAEGLGLGLVEALLAGSAVIGTPAGGIPEVVEDGVTGLLTPDGDASALADRLARLLQDEPLRRRLTAQGSERVRGIYSLEASVDRFLTLFDAAVHHRRRN
jgi:glycosyltransferase involved in cell wall biosynthesis